MLKFYQAYANYEELMDLTEELFRSLANHFFGKLSFSYQDNVIDFASSFQRKDILSLLQEHTNFSQEQLLKKSFIIEKLENTSIKFSSDSELGKLQFLLFEEFVESKLTQPTFVIGHPVEVSPLAKQNVNNPEVVDRFELYIAGCEVANGFNELNDPVEQKKRFLKHS